MVALASGPKRLPWGLYPIIDLEFVSPERATRVARSILASAQHGFINTIQLRAKGSHAGDIIAVGRALRLLTQEYETNLIINDRLDVALITSADGVHLGQDDIPMSEARKLLGVDKLIGRSTHSVGEAVSAIKAGADYISLGPIFPTSTKKDADPPKGLKRLEEVAEAVEGLGNIPIVAIGGITESSAGAVMRAGASATAVISDILLAKDIGKKIKGLLNEIGPPPEIR